jgi:hypothetical protein
VPDTRAYRISGSAQLFPQHCTLPNLTPEQHLQELTTEIRDIAASTDITTQQRVSIEQLLLDLARSDNNNTQLRQEEQRVINEHHPDKSQPDK